MLTLFWAMQVMILSRDLVVLIQLMVDPVLMKLTIPLMLLQAEMLVSLLI